MKRGLKYIILVAVLLCTSSLTAQEQSGKELFNKYNWFVSGTLNGEWLFETAGNMYLGGKVGGGIYLGRYSALRANFFAGKNRINALEAKQYGVGIDYMFTLIGNKGYRPFNLTAILGANYNFFDTKELDIKYNDIRVMGGTFAIQASYNINRRISLFFEPSLSILPQYYSEENEEDMYLQTNVAIGISYSFKDKYKSSSIKNKKQHKPSINNDDIKEIKDKMNLMLKEMEMLKKEVNEKQIVEKGVNLVIEPNSNNNIAIDIRFDEFGTFISQEQAQKIESIGEWMKENSAYIKIVAFSDILNDKTKDTELRNKRTETIKKLLTTKYHIAPERITSASPESMGYENKTGNNAMIIYMPEKL